MKDNFRNIEGTFSSFNKIKESVGLYNDVRKITSLTRQFRSVNNLRNRVGLNSPYHQIASAVSQISESNKMMSGLTLSYSLANISAAGGLYRIAQEIRKNNQNQAHTLGVAYQNLSNQYLKDFSKGEVNDLVTATQVNQEVSNLTERTILLSEDALLELQQSIIDSLKPILHNNTSEKLRQYIFEIITLISFIITLYSVKKDMNIKDSNDIYIQTQKDILEGQLEIKGLLADKLQKLNNKRVSITNVNLRKNATKNSPILGLVCTGQSVTVLEIQHKYLLIAYIDKKSGEPKSGFVVKKYFKQEK